MKVQDNNILWWFETIPWVVSLSNFICHFFEIMWIYRHETERVTSTKMTQTHSSEAANAVSEPHRPGEQQKSTGLPATTAAAAVTTITKDSHSANGNATNTNTTANTTTNPTTNPTTNTTTNLALANAPPSLLTMPPTPGEMSTVSVMHSMAAEVKLMGELDINYLTTRIFDAYPEQVAVFSSLAEVSAAVVAEGSVGGSAAGSVIGGGSVVGGGGSVVGSSAAGSVAGKEGSVKAGAGETLSGTSGKIAPLSFSPEKPKVPESDSKSLKSSVSQQGLELAVHANAEKDSNLNSRVTPTKNNLNNFNQIENPSAHRQGTASDVAVYSGNLFRWCKWQIGDEVEAFFNTNSTNYRYTQVAALTESQAMFGMTQGKNKWLVLPWIELAVGWMTRGRNIIISDSEALKTIEWNYSLKCSSLSVRDQLVYQYELLYWTSFKFFVKKSDNFEKQNSAKFSSFPRLGPRPHRAHLGSRYGSEIPSLSVR
jgi:hypothetical protein